MHPDTPQTVLIAGAGSTIGLAIHRELMQRWPDTCIMTLSRSSARELQLTESTHLKVDLTSPHSQDSIESFLETHQRPHWVFNCCGVLHTDRIKPEKSLKQLAAANVEYSMNVNVLTHVHLCQALERFLDRRLSFSMICLSAMVGSIGDNRSGGWYSYRMSKAALNMFVKTLSIEWARRFPQSAVVAVHPGTTDSRLSAPFQSGLPANRLFSSDTTAARMIDIMHSLKPDLTGSFFHWDNTTLPW